MNRLFSALALSASIGATTPASAQQSAPLVFTGYVTDLRGFNSERAQRTAVYPPARSQPLLAVFKDADDNFSAISCATVGKRQGAPAQKIEYAKADQACKAALAPN